MKKLLSIIIVAVMMVSYSATVIASAANNAVNFILEEEDYGIFFPDPVLREFMLLHFDRNLDGRIKKSEITFDYTENIVIDLSNTDVIDTEGLQHISFLGGNEYEDEYITENTNPQIEIELIGSTVQNILPLFKMLVNNKNILCRMNLWGCSGANFSGISELVDNNEKTGFLDINMNYTYISDCSGLQGYRVAKFEYVNARIEKGFSSDCLMYLNVTDSIGDGIITILENSPISELHASNDIVSCMNNTDNLERLEMQGDFTNDGLTKLMSKNVNKLSNITLNNTLVTDFTPLYDKNIVYLHYDCNNSVVDTIINGKTLGDYLLSQIPNIPSLELIWISDCRITDLTPIASFNDSDEKSMYLAGNWISLAYKNNKEIFEHRKEINSEFEYYTAMSISRPFSTNAVSSFSDGKGIDLQFEPSVNRKSFTNGDIITETIKITNTGTETADFNMYFNIQDEDWEKINIVNGSRTYSVKNLEPGQSIKKTVSFSSTGFEKGFYGIYSGILMCIGNDVAGVAFPRVNFRDNVFLYTAGTAICDRPMSIKGTCVSDMQSIQIQTADGEVIADVDGYSGGTAFGTDIIIPEKYHPDKGGTNTIQIKAVVTDKEGRIYSSSMKSVKIINPDVNSKLDIEDCNYMVYGSGHQYGELDPAIMYYGDRVIVRAKFAGVDQDDIDSVQAIINGSSYNMVRYLDGKYEGYYGAMSQGLTSGDYLDIILKVTTKMGEVLEKMVGYGRILIDPSGIITDPNGDPIEGVKVTLQKLQDDGSWADWDAENYLQTNPVYTNEEGYYGWDVPEGTYRIIAEKEGYVTKVVERYYSRDQGEETEITVLPPRMDVDFSMEYADPENPPMKPMTIEEAKKALENAVSGLKLSASADETAVKSKLMKYLTENMYVSFKSGTYVKAESTDTTEGSITGTLILENIWRDESQEISINIPLETIKATEFIDVFDNFTDKLMIEKIYGDNENVNLEISPKNNSDLPELKLYKALYTSEGILKKVDIVNAESVNGKTVISIEKPIVGENETFKLMLWTNEQIPVIEVIHNDTVGFFK